MSNRLPQSASSRAVVVDPVADGLTRVVLRSSFGLGVNAYVVQRGGVVGLIDAGFSHTVPGLVEGLSRLGLAPGDVDLFLPTHTHEDHLGGAVALGNVWSPRVVCAAPSVATVTDYVGHYESVEPWDAWATRHLSEGELAAWVAETRSPAAAEPLPPRHTLPAVVGVPYGARVEVGDGTLVCVDGRGHDPVHGGWYDAERNWLFGGDVLLRVPTPLLPAHADDLSLYRRTVERWAQWDDAWLLPGHGQPEGRVETARRRADAFLHALYDSVVSYAGSTFSPLDVAFLLAGGERTRAVATQTFVLLGTVWSQLLELEAHGAASRVEATRWRVHAAVPSYAELA